MYLRSVGVRSRPVSESAWRTFSISSSRRASAARYSSGLRRGEDLAVGPVERFLLDGAHRREASFPVAAAELVRAVVDEQQYRLRRHAETVVNAEKCVEIRARKRVAEHALTLAEQRAERPVIGAAAQYVLRAVYRQLVRSRQRHIPGGEKARPGEPARRRADLLSRAGESARRRRGIEHAAGAQNIKIQQRALPSPSARSFSASSAGRESVFAPWIR